MNNDEILQAAKDAGLTGLSLIDVGYLERFADIIEKRTIEWCANECNKNLIDQITYAEHAAIKKCASAIRKLGEQ